MAMTGDARWGQPENDADDDDAAGGVDVDVAVDVAAGNGIGNGNGYGCGFAIAIEAGKCDGPENSTEQKASAAEPTKAVGVICWSSLLLPLYLSQLPLFLLQLLSPSPSSSSSLSLLLFRQQFPCPGRWHPRSHSAAWRSASASAPAAARRVVIHPRGTVVSAAHNR